MEKRVIIVLTLVTAVFFSCGYDTEKGLNIEAESAPLVMAVEKNPAKGFYWPYFLYIPQNVKKEKPSIIFISNNTPAPSDDYADHYDNAKNKMGQYQHLAEDTGLPLLIFAIPRFETALPGEDPGFTDLWIVDPQALTRNTFLCDIPSLNRLDLQVLSIINDAAERLEKRELEPSRKIIPFGFSSSGTFASRFALLHPENTKMVIAGAPGGWFTLPLDYIEDTPLRYPIGVQDLERLTNLEFNNEGYQRIPKFFFVGSDDTDDAVPYLDSYAFEDRMAIYNLFGQDPQTRYQRYKELMVQNREFTFRVYQGMGHSISNKAYEDIKEFIRENEGR